MAETANVFAGKTVWITGASSGIGAALALAMARAGARLILSGRNADRLADVAGRCQTAVKILPFETTDIAALPAIVAEAEGWTGGIDVLVNNAGISQRSLARDTSFDVYRTIMEVDYFAPVALTQLVLPAMRARGSGHIIMVSSLAGKFGSALRTAYCSAKHALIGYAGALRAETTYEGLAVTVVIPGFVRTAIATNALNADGSVRGRTDDGIEGGISAEEAAETILAGLASGAFEIPVGRGPEMDMFALYKSDPAKHFAVMAQLGQAIGSAATLP